MISLYYSYIKFFIKKLIFKHYITYLIYNIKHNSEFRMQLTISQNTFDNFGDISYLCSCQLNQGFIKNISHDEDTYSYDTFKTCCINILLYETTFNLLEFHNLVFHLTNNNTSKMAALLIEVFDEVTTVIKSRINDSITNKTFTLQSFVDTYNSYLKNSLVLSKYLSYFDF